MSIGELDYSDRAAGLGGKFNDSVDSWRVTVGYQFLEHFAFEGTYGRTSTVRDTAAGFPPASAELGFETELSKILGFRALGTLPFDNGLSLMAGVAFVYIEQNVALSLNGAPFLSGEIDRQVTIKVCGLCVPNPHRDLRRREPVSEGHASCEVGSGALPFSCEQRAVRCCRETRLTDPTR